LPIQVTQYVEQSEEGLAHRSASRQVFQVAERKRATAFSCLLPLAAVDQHARNVAGLGHPVDWRQEELHDEFDGNPADAGREGMGIVDSGKNYVFENDRLHIQGPPAILNIVQNSVREK
jgi:hypothetical protein